MNKEQETEAVVPEVSRTDIEHAHVENDPRKWSNARKLMTLAIVAGAALIIGFGANIYNPSIPDIESELHASSNDISLSLSFFTWIQGCGPLLWSAISEIRGRKLVYITSITLFIVGSICVATAKNIGVVIGMRCLQALGSSAVMAIGAATLADIYEPSERGTMMGIYYTAPLLGPSIGPILGGGLTKGFNWRATFWFLVIFGGINLLSFIFLFKDTFRRERSLAYQTALSRRMREQKDATVASRRSSQRTVVPSHGGGDQPTPAKENEKAVSEIPASRDVEMQDNSDVTPAINEIKLSITDINPFKPIYLIMRRVNNIVIILPSALIFGFSYSISYTCSITLSDKYGYDSLRIGLVLLSFGIGSVAGSILGGRWSDRVMNRLKEKNNGKWHPEMRLENTIPAMPFLPLSVVAYAWLCQEHVHIATIVVSLFVPGFSSIWMYSSTLAYVVDANAGRSSSAVATNSAIRGTCAFIATEVAVPLQDAIGDGGLYTIWAGLCIVLDIMILLVWWKGGEWREKGETREKRSGR